MRWISSGGGPFLLLASGWLDHWRGVDGDDWADYDRACAVKGDVGRIDVGPGQALVVVNQVQYATWFAPQGSVPGMIVGWGAAESRRQMEAAVRHVPDSVFHRQGFRFRVATRRHYLFDSAYGGDRLGDTEHRRIHLEPGDYDVLTADYWADSQTNAILYRFHRRLGSA